MRHRQQKWGHLFMCKDHPVWSADILGAVDLNFSCAIVYNVSVSVNKNNMFVNSSTIFRS